MNLAPADNLTLRAGERRRLGGILLVAVLATLPLLLRGNSCGHDFDFHLQSWLAVAQGWRHGSFNPHWVAGANFGAGEPRLVFYPPLSWVLGALLGTVLPWRAAGAAFVLICLSGAGLSLYRLVREWAPRDAAALAACLFVVNPYSMFVVYERAAYGELLAAVWVPLVLLFALTRSGGVAAGLSAAPALTSGSAGLSRSAPRNEVALLGLSIAAVWLSNAPAAVMTCYMLAVVAMIAAVAERRWWPVLRAATGAALGIGLAGFYIVPAAYERGWVDIERAIGPGMRVEESFLFGNSGEPYHDEVLWTASWIAVALMVAFAAAAWVAWRAQGSAGEIGFARAGGERRGIPARVWKALLGLPVVILGLLLPYSELVWRYAPELRFLQFPWRWLLVMSVCAAALGGVVLSNWYEFRAELLGYSARLRRVVAIRGLLVLVVVLVAAEQALFWQACDSEDMVSAQVAVARGGGFAGTDEYTTPGIDSEGIQQGLPPVRLLREPDGDEVDSSLAANPAWCSSRDVEALPGGVDVQSWGAESMKFAVHEVRDGGFAVLRLMDYPAWEVLVNGSAVGARPRREDGLLTVPLRAGVSVVTVRYRVTPDVRWGRAITIAALVVLLILVLRQRRSRGKPQ